MSSRYRARLAEIGATPSVGTVGDSDENTQRFHGYLGDVPPAEFEESFYAGVTNAKELVEIT